MLGCCLNFDTHTAFDACIIQKKFQKSCLPLCSITFSVKNTRSHSCLIHNFSHSTVLSPHCHFLQLQMHHTFSVGGRSGLQGGQSGTCSVFYLSYTMPQFFWGGTGVVKRFNSNHFFFFVSIFARKAAALAEPNQCRINILDALHPSLQLAARQRRLLRFNDLLVQNYS